MRRWNLLRYVFAISVLACGIAQAGPILTNPGFESGSLTPWTNDHSFGTGIDWAITSTNCHSGSFCAVDTGNIGLEQTFSPIDVSSITAISFWVLHPSASVTALALDFFYVGGGDDEFVVSTTGSGWNFFDVFGHLRGTGQLNGFEIFGNLDGVTMADDFNITATAGVPEPTTFDLLLAGLSAIAIGARCRVH
jgi:hypothetical protein